MKSISFSIIFFCFFNLFGQKDSSTFWKKINHHLFSKQNQLEIGLFLGEYYFDNYPIKLQGITYNYAFVKQEFQTKGINSINRFFLRQILPFSYFNSTIPYPHTLFYRRIFKNSFFFTLGYQSFGTDNLFSLNKNVFLEKGDIWRRVGKFQYIGIGKNIYRRNNQQLGIEFNLIRRSLDQVNILGVIQNPLFTEYFGNGFHSIDFGYGLGGRYEFLFKNSFSLGLKINFNHLVFREVKSANQIHATSNFVLGFKL